MGGGRGWSNVGKLPYPAPLKIRPLPSLAYHCNHNANKFTENFSFLRQFSSAELDKNLRFSLVKCIISEIT